MYIVASIWKLVPGKEAEAQALGLKMRDLLRSTDGVQSLTQFEIGPGERMVVMGYRDEATYQKIIQDPNGVFNKALADLNLESVMTWVQSWRGPSMDD